MEISLLLKFCFFVLFVNALSYDEALSIARCRAQCKNVSTNICTTLKDYMKFSAYVRINSRIPGLFNLLKI